MGRPGDIQYAVKELCRKMLPPNISDTKRLRKLGRYLVGRLRQVRAQVCVAGRHRKGERIPRL